MYRDLTKRIMALALSVCMIAGMVDLSGLTVRAAETTIQNANVEVAAAEYNGSPQEPAVTVTDFSGSVLSQGTDYTLKYSNNTNAGTATVTVTNTKDQTDTQDVDFTITRRPITSSGIVFPSADELAREISQPDMVVTPIISVTDNGRKLTGRQTTSTTADLDFAYSFTNNVGPGTATVTILGVNNYSGMKEISFDISMLDASKLTFDFVDDLSRGWPYEGGDAIEPPVQDVAYDGTPLKSDEYVVRYASNRYAGQAETWIEGQGSRFGGLVSEHKTFPIVKSISNRDRSGSRIGIVTVL